MKKILIRVESHNKNWIWWMETRILEFCKNLKHNFYFLTNSKFLIKENFFWKNKTIFSNYFSIFWILKDIFTFRNFEIIDSNWLRDNIISSLNYFIFFIFYKINKTKLFLTIHWNQGILEVKWVKKIIYNLILKLWFLVSDKIIVISEELKDFLIKKYKISDKKIEVIENFINFENNFFKKNNFQKKWVLVSRIDKNKYLWIEKTIIFCIENNIFLDVFWDWECLKILKNKFKNEKNINFLWFIKQEKIDYKNYDFIFAMWRAILEWISNNLVWFLIWYDDLICKLNLKNYKKIKYSNFSGRKVKKEKIDFENIFLEKKEVFEKVKKDFDIKNLKDFYN